MSDNLNNASRSRDTSSFAPLSDLRAALVFLTRVPVGGPHRAINRCAWAFPLVGLFVGGVGATVFFAAYWIGLGPLFSAILCLISTAMVTGALHEDGLADSLDGLFGGRDKARVLEIMRDSRLGAYGGLGLVLVTGAKAAALLRLFELGAVELTVIGLVLSHLVARAVLPLVMALMPLADQTGVAASAGRPSLRLAFLGLCIAVVVSLLAVGVTATLIFSATCFLACLLLIRLVYARIGGYNGDALGMIEQVSELAVLAGLSIATVFFPDAIGVVHVF